jgi:hypothetical protein
MGPRPDLCLSYYSKLHLIQLFLDVYCLMRCDAVYTIRKSIKNVATESRRQQSLQSSPWQHQLHLLHCARNHLNVHPHSVVQEFHDFKHVCYIRVRLLGGRHWIRIC